jgi:hypothetical protein
MQLHVLRRDLGDQRFVAAHQLVGVAAEPPDRRVHQSRPASRSTPSSISASSTMLNESRTFSRRSPSE